MHAIERYYAHLYKNIVKALNPIKKRIIKTECTVHQFINKQSIVILKNDGYLEVYNFMANYINDINAGVVWADQDLKSSSHFYNPTKDDGLYGNSDAKRECIRYYTKALNEYSNGNIKEAMFYFGASCHLIQDLTVPQHANVELLHNHRSYENWVIEMYKYHHEFKVYKGGIYYNNLRYYINFNSKKAIDTHKRYLRVENQNMRFYKVTSIILTLAQKTTAGLMYKFYYDIQKLNSIKLFKHEHNQ